MVIQVATPEDIPQIQLVRNAVKENVLSNPALVTDSDCALYLNVRGKGWVCKEADKVTGFAIADLAGNNIWALFVHPDFEKKGIGSQLHQFMLNWYFTQTRTPVWLGTAPGTRAEAFYRKVGWEEDGTYGKGEIKFRMTYPNWMNVRGLSFK